MSQTDHEYAHVWEVWREQVKEYEAGLPFELVYHCSEENPMYFLAIGAGRVLTACRGYPETFDPRSFECSAEDIARAREVAIQLGLDPELIVGDPHWQLMSYWG